MMAIYILPSILKPLLIKTYEILIRWIAKTCFNNYIVCKITLLEETNEEVYSQIYRGYVRGSGIHWLYYRSG